MFSQTYKKTRLEAKEFTEGYKRKFKKKEFFKDLSANEVLGMLKVFRKLSPAQELELIDKHIVSKTAREFYKKKLKKLTSPKNQHRG